METNILDLVREALQDRNILRVSHATGIARNTLYRIRNGDTIPHASTLAVLAKYLGVAQ